MKVQVKPLVKATSIMENTSKDGATGYAGTKQVFTLPTTERGGWVEILDEKEIEKFAKKLNRKPEELNFFEPDPAKRHLHFWSKFLVELKPEGVDFDTNDPIDELKLKILKKISVVAPNWSARYDRGEYKFVILEEDVEAKETASKADIAAKAFMEFGSMRDNNSKMVSVLTVAGKFVAPTKRNHNDFLKSEVFKLVQENPKEFLSIVEDPDFNMKVFISEAIACKAIIKGKYDKYTLPEGDPIGNYEELIEYLKDPENNPVKMKIEAQIDVAKGK